MSLLKTMAVDVIAQPTSPMVELDPSFSLLHCGSPCLNSGTPLVLTAGGLFFVVPPVFDWVGVCVAVAPETGAWRL